MDAPKLRGDRELLRNQLRQIEAQLAQLTSAKYRAEGALNLLDKQIADEESLPKLKEL